MQIQVFLLFFKKLHLLCQSTLSQQIGEKLKSMHLKIFLEMRDER
jgi:hypothetical protein